MVTLEDAFSDESMPPKLDQKTKTERVQLVAPQSLIGRVNAWRKRQDDFYNLSAAIRKLLEQALDDDEARIGKSSDRGA